MTGLVTRAALVWALGTTGWSAGYATRYNEHVMHRAAANHGLPVADCMVSWDHAPLGAFVWVRSQNTGRLLRCQVSDLSAPEDRVRHLRAGLVEADWASARDLCGGSFDGPWRECRVWVLR